MPIMSALPFCKIASACSKVVMPPVATMGVANPALFTALLIAATKGTARPNGPRSSESVVGPIATGNYFIGEKSDADNIIIADAFAYRAINFQRQTHAIFAWTTITIVAFVQRAEKSGHRVRVGVMQFDAIESGLTRAVRGGGKNFREHVRQITDMR